jgi:hemerythrin
VIAMRSHNNQNNTAQLEEGEMLDVPMAEITEAEYQLLKSNYDLMVKKTIDAVKQVKAAQAVIESLETEKTSLLANHNAEQQSMQQKIESLTNSSQLLQLSGNKTAQDVYIENLRTANGELTTANVQLNDRVAIVQMKSHTASIQHANAMAAANQTIATLMDRLAQSTQTMFNQNAELQRNATSPAVFTYERTRQTIVNTHGRVLAQTDSVSAKVLSSNGMFNQATQLSLSAPMASRDIENNINNVSPLQLPQQQERTFNFRPHGNQN